MCSVPFPQYVRGLFWVFWLLIAKSRRIRHLWPVVADDGRDVSGQFAGDGRDHGSDLAAVELNLV